MKAQPIKHQQGSGSRGTMPGPSSFRVIALSFADGSRHSIRTTARTVAEFKREVLEATAKGVNTLYSENDEEFLGDDSQLTDDHISGGLVATSSTAATAWVYQKDESLGLVYFNKETNEISQTKPEGFSMQTDVDGDGEADDAQVKARSAVKGVLEGKATKLDTGVEARLREVRRAEVQAEAARRRSGGAALENTWVEVFDPAANAYYYYGTASGAVTWDKPSSYVMAAEDELMRSVIRIQCMYRAGRARRRTAAMGLAGTLRRRRPAAEAEQAAVSKAQAAARRAADAAAELTAEVWVAVFDVPRNAYYYYEKNSHRTSWTRYLPSYYVVFSFIILLLLSLYSHLPCARFF